MEEVILQPILMLNRVTAPHQFEKEILNVTVP